MTNSAERDRCRAFVRIARLLPGMAAVLCGVNATEAEELPPDLTPYRVEISIGFENSAEFPPAFRDRVRRDVRQTIVRSVGERWLLNVDDVGSNAELSTAPILTALTLASVPIDRRGSPEGAPRGFLDDAAPDKCFFASVKSSGAGYVASAREWDRLTDTLGPVRTEKTVAREEIAAKVSSAVLAAFRPVGLVGSVTEETASVAIRADGIPSADHSVTAIDPETPFIVVLRKFDRDGALIEVRPVPFTYLEISGVSGGEATATIRSALRRPLSARRGRIEAWAVAAPASTGATRLLLTRRGDGVPLPGRLVEVRSKAPVPGEEESEAERTLLTDRSGAVSIAVASNRPLVWLTIRSGDATLMRLPLAPGVEQEVALPLGDDQRRLDAESRISIVTGELIEMVAKRATLLAKARTAARAARYDEADAALAEAARLPDAAAFRRRIAAVEAPAAEAADQAKDRVAAARIRALGRKATGLVDRYLNADALRTTREEVEELKRTDPDRIPLKEIDPRKTRKNAT